MAVYCAASLLLLAVAATIIAGNYAFILPLPIATTTASSTNLQRCATTSQQLQQQQQQQQPHHQRVTTMRQQHCLAASTSSSSTQLAVSVFSQRSSRSSRIVLQAMDDDEYAYESHVRSSGNSTAIIDIVIPAELTKVVYEKAIRQIQKEAEIPGFAKGRKIPQDLVINYYGPKNLKIKCMEELTETAIKQAVQRSGLRVIGQANLINTAEELLESFEPGLKFPITVKVDVWPEIKWTDAYTGLTLEVNEPEFDIERYNAAMKNIKERAIKLQDTAEDYAAVMGDSAIVDMFPYEELPDGSRGDPLPALASGDEVEVVLLGERYMPGLVDGLVGAKAGDTREVRVTFPEKMGASTATLQGKKAIFEIKVRTIKTRYCPPEGDELAAAIRPELTWAELKKEVVDAVKDEGMQKGKELRNKEIEERLLERVEVDVPETLVLEQSKQKFAVMMTEMRDQGADDETIKKMISKENFDKYIEISRKSTTKTLQLSLLLNSIAEKEGLQPNASDVEDQMELLRAEAKGQEFDEAGAKDKIEAALQREKVLEWVAQNSNITLIPAVVP